MEYSQTEFYYTVLQDVHWICCRTCAASFKRLLGSNGPLIQSEMEADIVRPPRTADRDGIRQHAFLEKQESPFGNGRLA